MLRCGLIGENIGRSRLELALEVLCKQTGQRLEFSAFDTSSIEQFDFEHHVKQLGEAGYDGVTITHPWKTRADALADQRDGYPAGLGACNLLLFDPSGLRGLNTDYTGMVAAWKARFGETGPGNVAIAGAGGVARAIVAALIKCGADRISVWDPASGRALELAHQIDPAGSIVHAVNISQAPVVCATANGLINATPLGMREYPGTPIKPEFWGPHAKWAFDAVYTPVKTGFMLSAEQSGLTCISGFELFRHMAVRSFAAYTGTRLDPHAADILHPLAVGL